MIELSHVVDSNIWIQSIKSHIRVPDDVTVDANIQF